MSESDNDRPSRTQPARRENAIQTRYDELVRAAEATCRVYTPAEAMALAGETRNLIPEDPRYVSALHDAVEIIFYCASGARSVLTAQRARELGYGRVGHLDGGFSAWKDVGGPMHGADARWW